MKRSSLRQRGARTQRLARWHGWSRNHTYMRCVNSGRHKGVEECEACGEPVSTDWAHLFGRGNVISEPWCSLPELTARLCRNCHNAIDRSTDVAMRQRLRWAALHRLAERWPVLAPVVDEAHASVFSDALPCARECERMLEAGDARTELPSFAPE